MGSIVAFCLWDCFLSHPLSFYLTKQANFLARKTTFDLLDVCVLLIFPFWACVQCNSAATRMMIDVASRSLTVDASADHSFPLNPPPPPRCRYNEKRWIVLPEHKWSCIQCETLAVAVVVREWTRLKWSFISILIRILVVLCAWALCFVCEWASRIGIAYGKQEKWSNGRNEYIG